ncbi:MAG: response regulator, partial [Planctomycetes bacterium]|nr:response regulator [Planctomycetota bacterium]
MVESPEQANPTTLAGTGAGPCSGESTLRVLLVEDDPDVVEAIRVGFAQSGIFVQHAGTLADGAKMLEKLPRFDAIILDRTLPDGEGTDFADQCRRGGNEIPILMVTAKDTVADRVDGLSHGADDYLCKPFAVEELRARLEAVLRRARPKHRHILHYADV